MARRDLLSADDRASLLVKLWVSQIFDPNTMPVLTARQQQRVVEELTRRIRSLIVDAQSEFEDLCRTVNVSTNEVGNSSVVAGSALANLNRILRDRLKKSVPW